MNLVPGQGGGTSMRKNLFVLGLLFSILAVSLFIGCGGDGDVGAEPERIFRDTESVRIQWEEVTTDIQGGPEYIDHYDFFYRRHGDTEWIFYGEVPDIQDPWIEVWHDDLGNGEWEFGVKAVDVNGNVSDTHHCMDGTAVPPEWYLYWVTDPQSIPPSKSSGMTLV
jgi:hypothetical protein